MSGGRFKTKILYPDFVYRCNHCQYEIKSKRALDLHLKISHGVVNRKSSAPSSLEFCDKFLCCSCRENFPSKNSLEHHKMINKHYQ